MKKLNQFVSLLLVFSMLLPSFPANAVVAIDQEVEEENPIPQSPPGTPAGIVCSQLDQTPNPLNGVCCVPLVKNGAGKCDEPPYNDPSLVSCSSSADCSGGTGCFPQSASDLYSGLSPSTEDPEIISEKKQELEDHLSEANPKPVGASCIHPRDCSSYSCNSLGKCEDKKVCRFADAGEVATAGINCGKDLLKKPNGLCEVDPNAKNPVYLGLLTESTIKPLGQCEFQLDEESRKKSIIAMQSLRAMEFFLASISVPADKECFDVMPLLKNEIGNTFMTTRKNILTNFTDVLNQIEFDYKQLIAAKEKSETVITIHNDETIKEGDLATRQTSGYDNLMMMYRRNLLFQSYETAMLDTVKASNVKVAGLSKSMGDWKDGDTSWNIGTKVVNAYNCEGSKYKKKKFLGSWKTKYYDKVKDRWSVHYEVSGSAAGNADIVKRDGVAEVLKLIGGKATKEDAIAEFTKSKYYLMDPMLFSGMQYQGASKALKKKSSFLGLFGGFKDLRKAYYIKGDSAGSFKKMHTDLKPKITEFYKNLKLNKEQKGFIYEPELLTTEAKDCLDNPADPSKCAKFQPFLDGVHDESFAHFLAYSYSTKDDYSGFFSNATTYRRKLLAKMEVDMQNISKYYETIIGHRNKQNECIERVINGLADSGILESDQDGLGEGSYFDPTRGVTQPGVNTSRKTTSAIRKLSPISRGKFTFNLAGNLNKLGTGSMMDNIASSGSSSSRAGVSASESAFLAARKDAMVKANSKASGAGINVAAKEKAVMDSINKLARGGSGAGSGASGAGASGFKGSSSFGFGDGTGKAAVSGDDASGEGADANKAAGINGAGEIGIGGAANAGAGAGADGFAGIAAGSGSGADDGAGAGATAGATDGTGLSDADKDKLMSEYERNKRDYEGSEEDGIFSKVSKAYVRNLDKVLIKKKKIEP